MLHFLLILGSTRPGRKSEKVAAWFQDIASQRKNMEFERIDFREWDFPLYNESVPPMAGKYEHPLTKRWSETVSKADGYVVVTPEYNHGYPAALKNALDYLYMEWNRKPLAFVSYGGAGGVRSVEQLVPVAVELQMMPLRHQVKLLPGTFQEDGTVNDSEFLQKQANALLDQLEWWATTLKGGREAQNKI